MPASSTCDVMLLESGCTPLLHAWVSRLVGWYNRIIARSNDDIVKIALKANAEIAFGTLPVAAGVLPANPKCWFGTF